MRRCFQSEQERATCLLLFCCMAALWGGGTLPLSAQMPFRIMEYNVENLFDCEDDSLKNDEEFLPGATGRWTYTRYHDKLTKIAKVIAAAGEERVPDLVALCEVENERVLIDLTQRSPLREVAYRFIVTDSPDWRGIDVALLYQPASFRLLAWRAIPVSLERFHHPPTRDILHVTGQVVTGDTLDVFVCHMPSRYGGQKESEPCRLFAASLLRAQVDSLMAVRKVPRLLITGDFNDYPHNASLSQVLRAQQPAGETADDRTLYNLMAGRKHEGTYRYRGEWGILDQLIVSGRLLSEEEVFSTSCERVRILRFPFLMTEDERYGGPMPFRTYLGPRYLGGYSDHLPVLAEFGQ